jgi:hypothetical protein
MQPATFAALALGLLVCVAWFLTADGSARFEPLVTGLAVVAGTTGVFAERWVASRQKRDEALDGVSRELANNLEVRQRFFHREAPEARVYPRFLLSATETALISGALTGDTALIQALQRWSDLARDLNHRLDLAEIKTFVAASADEIADIEGAIYRKGGPLEKVDDALRSVASLLSTGRSDADLP